jgi:hypothetical protein
MKPRDDDWYREAAAGILEVIVHMLEEEDGN